MDSLPHSSRVSLRDIASALGLHYSTVSRALNNNPSITPAIRQKVHDTAAKMGYFPDPSLSALAHYRNSKSPKKITAEIAWINGWSDPNLLLSYREFQLYWRGAMEEAERCGYRLTEFVLGNEMSAHRMNHILSTRNIAGILIPPHQAPPDWAGMDWSKFCIVRFGYSINNPRAHLVTSNQSSTGLIAVQNMLEAGYERVGLAISKLYNGLLLGGYAVAQMKLPVASRITPLTLDYCRFKHPDRKEALQQLSQWIRKSKPDAILTNMAEMPGFLRELGIEIPHQMGLASCSILDGDADAGIYQNSAEIGKAAVQLLVSLIHHNERGIPRVSREVLIEPTWVDGTSLPQRRAVGTPVSPRQSDEPHRR